MTIDQTTVPAYPSKARLAAELDMAESTVDEMVKRGILPAPMPDGLFDWSSVVERLERPNPIGTIYVAGFGQYVKIGFTTQEVSFRISGIQTGAPERLEIFAELPGTRADERSLHKRFAAYRTYGEWFKRSDEIDAWIKERQ